MYFQKFIDDLLGKFYSNARYTNSFFQTLKFFFERNTKHFNTLDKLGNVYRSSKWVGLKLRNLNATSLSRFGIFMVLVFVFVFLTLKLSGSSFMVLLAAPVKVISYFMDLLYYSWLVIVALGYSVLARVKKSVLYCFLRSLTLKNRLRPKRRLSDQPQLLQNVALPFNGTYNNAYSRSVLPGIFHFYKLQSSTISIERCFFGLRDSFSEASSLLKIVASSYRSPSHACFNSINLYNDTIAFLEDPKYKANLGVPYITDLEDSFAIDNGFGSQNVFKYVYPFSPSQSFFAICTFSSEKNVLSNIVTDLTLGKENRWHWKSNMFSNNLVQALNSFNQTKKYINNPLFSSFCLNRNLWVSTKIADNVDLQLMNLSDSSFDSSSNLLASKGGKSSYLSLNFTEDSVLWSLNRFLNYQNMQSMQRVTTNLSGHVTSPTKIAGEGSLPTNIQLSLIDYHFILSKLHIALPVRYTLSEGTVVPSHLGEGSDSPLLNHSTLNSLEVSFASTSNSANKLIFFSNL